MSDGSGLREWVGTLRITGTAHARGEHRRARAALKRTIKSANGNDEAVGLQLSGQAMPSRMYERFRTITNHQHMKRRRLGQTLPDSHREGMVVVWGLEARTEVVPLLSVREFPKVLGTIVAVRCAGDFRYDQGFVAGLVSWLEINADKAPACRPPHRCFNSGTSAESRLTRPSTLAFATHSHPWTS